MRIRLKELRKTRKRAEERHKAYAAKPAVATTKKESKPKAKTAAKDA